MALDPAWIALIGTLSGGVVLKLTEAWLGKNRSKIDDASRIRDELRIEIQSQRDEIRALEILVDKWRADYYNLRDEHAKLQTELLLAIQKIKDQDTPIDPPK